MECDDGTLCAADQLCHSTLGCVFPDQLTACAGLGENAPCHFRVTTGVCEAGACAVVRCGDGRVDVGEACDDGNQNPADGCDACVATQWLASAAIGGNLLATGAGLADPSGVAIDRHGNIFTADTGNHRIRRVDAQTGVIATVAGTGTWGFSGDGGTATSA